MGDRVGTPGYRYRDHFQSIIHKKKSSSLSPFHSVFTYLKSRISVKSTFDKTFERFKCKCDFIDTSFRFKKC